MPCCAARTTMSVRRPASCPVAFRLAWTAARSCCCAAVCSAVSGMAFPPLSVCLVWLGMVIIRAGWGGVFGCASGRCAEGVQDAVEVGHDVGGDGDGVEDDDDAVVAAEQDAGLVRGAGHHC